MPIIEEIIQAAVQAGASDVHIMTGIAPKMRVGGSLLTMNFPKLTAKDTLEIVLSMMTQPQRERFEERGEYDMSFTIEKLGRCRVHVYKEKGLTALAVRLISALPPSPESLELPEVLISMYEKACGLILITGASGSGKSTTLAAMADKINHNREAHVVTLEEPIEYVHRSDMSMISQREIGADSQSHAAALRAVMREDADVIMIDEMYGAESIDAAIAAVETGHLVFAVMSASVVGTPGDIEKHVLEHIIGHMIEVFPISRQKQICMRLSNVLEAVVMQTLLPSSGSRPRRADFEIICADDAFRSMIRERK